MCRTYVGTNINGQEGPSRRGNNAPVTINLPRLGIKAKGDLNKFWSLLDDMLNLCKESLLHRHSILCKLRVKDLPFAAGEGIMMGSENLGPDDTIEPILKNGTYGIGFVGLAETLVALIGKHHGESKEADELGYKIVSHIREYCDKTKEETHLNFSCYYSPAESTAGTFANADREKYGIIKGVTDHDFYTNSVHIPVYYNISIKDKIDIESKYHYLGNGGHIFYVEVDGYPSKEQIKKIVDYAFDQSDISYMGINFHIRYCKKCGKRVTNNVMVCDCGSTAFQGISRITGYLALDGRWGQGKVAERKMRVSHTTGKNVYTE
jgi:ribonucleoside-triphosphate reductase